MTAPQSPPAPQVTDPCLLIVEGQDDVRFLTALLRDMKPQLGGKNVGIRPMDGKTKLRNALNAVRSEPGFHRVTCLGVVRDANGDPNRAFQSIQDALGASSFAVPKSPLELAGDGPQVCAMLWPKINTPGTLEDLCLEAVSDDPATRCVKGYFDCLKDRSLTLPAELSKARLHVFLASRDKPDLRLGEAAEAGYWPWKHPAFEEVKQFLRTVCDITSS